MTVIVTYKPANADLLRSAYVGLRSRPLVFALSFGFFVVVPWLAALCGIVASLLGVPTNPLPVLSLIAVPPVAVAAFSVIMLFQVRDARSLAGTHTYKFSCEDIRLKGPGFNNRIEWAILTRYHVSNHGWLFMSGNAPLIFVPGRSLTSSSENQLEKLVALKEIKVTGQRKVNAKQDSGEGLG